ncbi:SDR family NAD(P)-dependent oxidoreductase [Microbacterium sp. 2P01SA-2]|uniref:SDR family NAD(P)-dependent oxidoreductase n=1 Tax=unclassified Microbacterium TaxID=2609290 RepID=UPI0039A0A79C
MSATTSHPRLAGRTIVVVGASSGIGRAVALRAAAAGASVVVFSRRADALDDLARCIRDRGGRAHVVPGDVGRTEDLEWLAIEAERVFGSIDVWVGNAGVATVAPFWEAPLDEHLRVVDTNLAGVMRGTHIALSRFIERGSGVIVNTASVESVVPLALQASYAATKAGVLSLTRALRQELRLAGITGVAVAAVLPWAVRTPFWRHAGNHAGRALRLPLMDEPEVVADAILRAAVAPRERLAVGWKARAALAGHRVAPGLTTRLAADLVRSCLRRGDDATPSSGAVHHGLGDPAAAAETPRPPRAV